MPFTDIKPLQVLLYFANYRSVLDDALEDYEPDMQYNIDSVSDGMPTTAQDASRSAKQTSQKKRRCNNSNNANNNRETSCH